MECKSHPPSTWPFSHWYATRLDKMQSDMTQHLVVCEFKPNESESSFFDRRAMLSGRLCSTFGRWSQIWALRVRTWHAHVCRARDPLLWGPKLYNCITSRMLEEKRISNMYTSPSRTDTRAPVSAHVAVRWHDGYLVANGVPPPPSKASIADILRKWERSPWHRYNDFAMQSQ